MKDCWITFDTATGAKTGHGHGRRDASCLRPNEVIRYRDTLAEVQSEASVVAEEAYQAAVLDISKANMARRDHAYARKDYYARQFIVATENAPDKTLTGAAGLAAIDPVLFPPIYKEYAATHMLTGWTPWELCAAINAKANAVDDAESQRRADKLNALQALTQPIPPIPNE